MKTLTYQKLVAIAAICLGLLTTPAFAVPVVVNFNATLWSNLGSLAYGTALNGSLTFDDAQLPSGDWGSAGLGTYYNNFASSATIGSQTIANPISEARLANDSTAYSDDFVSLMVNFPPTGDYFSLGGLNKVSTQFVFWGWGNNIINDESLTSVPGLVPGNAGLAIIYFYDGAYAPNEAIYLGAAGITSWQTSNVPDQSLTLGLLAAGMSALLVLRRRLGRG